MSMTPSLAFPFLFLLLLLSSLHQGGNCASPQPDILHLNATVEWSGAQTICGDCGSEYIHTDTYACSNEYYGGHWDNGLKMFADPLEPEDWGHFVLTRVEATLLGVFDCKTILHEDQTLFSVFLQDFLVVYGAGPNAFRWCECPNCVSSTSYVSDEIPGGWPNYEYGGNNSIQVYVMQNTACLSSIQLKLTYTRGSFIPTSTTVPESTSTSGAEDQEKSGLIVLIATVGVVLCVAGSSMTVLYLWFHFRSRSEYQTIKEPVIFFDESKYQTTRTFIIKGNELKLGPRIGKGSYGDVFRAKWRKIDVAVKKLPIEALKNKDFLQDFNQEAIIMSSLRHPNVLQFLGTCLIGSEVCIIMEFMSLGSVYKLLHNDTFVMDWAHVEKFALDTAQGMLYLHRCNPQVLHRDLKSSNLLVEDTLKVKISDFGLAKVLENMNGTMTSCGTPSWAAPEVLKNNKYTQKADVYSYGVCLWEFFTRTDPYEGMPAFHIIFAVGSQGLRPTLPDNCPPEYARLISDCWHADSERRPDFEEIIQRLEEMEFDKFEKL